MVQFFAQSSEIHDEDEVEKLDGLLERCMAEIEEETLIKISHQLSGLTNAPPRSIAWLAHHDDIIIAGPVLAHSPCARESDLLSVAESKGTLHLLAISERPTLNSIVTDVLIHRGGKALWHALVKNRGAKFSEPGVEILVGHAIGDDFISICLAARGDLSRAQIVKVLTSASETVCDKLSRANPKYAELIAESVARTASTMRGTLRDKMASFRVALDHVSDLYRHGRLDEEKIAEFAKDRKFDEIVVSLSLLARIDVDTAERALAEAGIQNMLMLAKVTGISWRTTIQVLRARLGSAGISKVELDQAKARFYRINRETARRILMFKARDQNEMTEAEIMSN